MPALVWLHGGGHVVGTLDTYDAICRSLALQADCIVVSVDYRLAPDHPYPAALDDCQAAFELVHREAPALGLDATRLVLAGQSAGGGLAAALNRLGINAAELPVYTKEAPPPVAPVYGEVPPVLPILALAAAVAGICVVACVQSSSNVFLPVSP